MKNILKWMNLELLELYWPLFYPLYKRYSHSRLYYSLTLGKYLSNFIIDLMKNTEKENKIAKMISFILYKLSGGEDMFSLIEHFTFPYANDNFNSTEITVLEFLLPLLMDEEIKFLVNQTKTARIKIAKRRKVVQLIKEEGKRRRIIFIYRELMILVSSFRESSFLVILY